jgi:hypothetical protein
MLSAAYKLRALLLLSLQAYLQHLQAALLLVLQASSQQSPGTKQHSTYQHVWQYKH